MANSNSKVEINQKLVLGSTEDATIKLPREWLHSMGWKIGQEVEISNAWWDGSKEDKCYKIQIELSKKPKIDIYHKGRWAK